MTLLVKSINVVIPIYKPLDKDDLFALQSLNNLFDENAKRYTIAISLIGDRKNIDEGEKKIKEILDTNKISIDEFDDFYFTNRFTYNLLLMSKEFYQSYCNSDFIMIFQLDALIIGNDLDPIIEMNPTFIGAPWFKENDKSTFDEVAVGNGGLSLRKVSDFIAMTSNFNRVPDWCWKYYVPGDSLKRKLFKLFVFWPFTLRARISNKTIELDQAKYDSLNEDHTFAQIIMQHPESFGKISPEDALKFSFEEEPRYCFELNDNKLPFGCHAWKRYDKEFWLENLSSIKDE